MRTNVQKIQAVFFDAMMAGWVRSDTVGKIEIPEFPGLKIVRHEDRTFVVLDTYLVSLGSEKSTGATTIFSRGQPVWAMHYGGYYSPTAIPFLKSCLYQSYSDRKFFGGRGPRLVQGERFTYVNRIDLGDFSNFKGEEQVNDVNGQALGFHWYRGELF